MTLTREILNSHPISTLKKEISKTNIKGYSKMKKDEVVELMMKNKERFGHIKKAEKRKPISKKDPKVQKIAKDFEKAISKGKDVAERVRKTKDVKPEEEEGTKVARRTTADGEKVLVEMPVKTGSVVYEATGDNDEIGTWDAESKTVVPEGVKDFLGAIGQSGKDYAERVRKTKDIPPPKVIAETKASPTFTKKDLNDLPALTLFAQLPAELRLKIGGNVGEEFIEAWNEGKQLKGFKVNDMKKVIRKIQSKIFKKAIGKGAAYKWKNPGDLTTLLRRDKDLIKKPGLMSDLFNMMTKAVKDEIKVLKPKQPKPKAPLTEAQKKKRDEAVNVGNMYQLIDDYDLRDDEYSGNVMDNLAYAGYKGATLGSTEQQFEKLIERVRDVEDMRYKRAIAQFLKDTKPKPKNLPDAMEKFKSWIKENYDGNISDMMDDFIKSSDFRD